MAARWSIRWPAMQSRESGWSLKTIVRGGSFGTCLLNQSFDFPGLFWIKTGMRIQNGAVLVQQIAGWHSGDVKCVGCFSGWVKGHDKRRRKIGEEIIRQFLCLVQVERDNLKAFWRVLLVKFYHPGERLAAGRAPRSPKIHVHDLPAKRIERHISRLCWKRKTGSVLWIGPWTIGCYRHGYRGKNKQ